MANLQLDNSEILGAIALVAALDRNTGNWTADELTDARAAIRSGLRKFFHPMVDGNVHQWRFQEQQTTLSSRDQESSSTITVVAGLATLASGNWSSWTVDGLFRIGGNTYYPTAAPSTNTIQLNDTGLDAVALTTYTVDQWRHQLPSDFGELIDGVIYQNGDESRRLEGATEHEIRLRHSTQYQLDKPKKFAVFKGETATSTTFADAPWYLSVWPILEDETYLQLNYRQEPPDKLAATLTDEGGNIQVNSVHAETLLSAIMSSAEEYYNDEANGVHSQRFNRLLLASIKHDRHASGPVEFSTDRRINRRAVSLLNHEPDYLDLL